MRVALLLLCLPLAACSGASIFPGGLSAPEPASAPPPSVAERTPPTRAASGGGGGARGGASTAAARAAVDPDAPNPGADPLTQARADCWMKVEGQKALRGIDQRITFVDKCVADQMKNGPKS